MSVRHAIAAELAASDALDLLVWILVIAILAGIAVYIWRRA